VTNIRAGVVLNQASLKQDASPISEFSVASMGNGKHVDCRKGKKTNQSVQKKLN